MSKERPYEFVPTYALIILTTEYAKLIRDGNFKSQIDLEKVQKELETRFTFLQEEDRQISIEEWQRTRKDIYE